MKRIEAHWLDFKSKVYKHGMLPDQERQLKDAFFAGADIAFETISWISAHKTEDEAMQALTDFTDEITAYAGHVASRSASN